jgi:hypothetical protein
MDRMGRPRVEQSKDLEGKNETTTCDFKSEYDFTKPTTVFEVAKDVAAFDSAMGGNHRRWCPRRQGRREPEDGAHRGV